jgi:hypothetical protein
MQDPTRAPAEPAADPETPELAEARVRFSAGDFRTARSLAAAALDAAPGDRPEVKLEAQMMLRRLAPDPFAQQLTVVCTLGLAILAWFTLGR